MAHGVAALQMLGQFNEPFEDEFYFWQTGVVVLMFLIFGHTAAMIYALVFSIVAIVLHERYSPYKNDAMDDLQMTILVNQFLIQIMIVLLEMDNSHETIVGVGMLILQILIIAYAMTLIVPAFSPAISQLWDTLSEICPPIYERHRATIVGRRWVESTPDENIVSSETSTARNQGDQTIGRETEHTSRQLLPPPDGHNPAEDTSDRHSICSETSTTGIQEEQTMRSEMELILLQPLSPPDEDANNLRANDRPMGDSMWKSQEQTKTVITSNPVYGLSSLH
ncbi:hypothetical protein CYMTET_24870 [Cymbomonas tetramitiformis]|uniref:Uncharacterized protein n=1 Tax=Cymbomonas tetramitiformis TaxID=36881 RepID=A0AAE0FV77_9CHLO|nr:hypothetical protein CYMTET_24870 [Cymbomonas tetramitiformis]